jgi:3',5'-cyclic AMP phosphodiesterase CpdA
MPAITWLHLTDLHFNTNNNIQMSRQRWLWPNVRELFFQDLERLRRFTGDWDLVFFTGDLAQSGTVADYTALDRDVLARLWQEFRRLGSNPILLAVPGDHDLTWPDA